MLLSPASAFIFAAPVAAWLLSPLGHLLGSRDWLCCCCCHRSRGRGGGRGRAPWGLPWTEGARVEGAPHGGGDIEDDSGRSEQEAAAAPLARSPPPTGGAGRRGPPQGWQVQKAPSCGAEEGKGAGGRRQAAAAAATAITAPFRSRLLMAPSAVASISGGEGEALETLTASNRRYPLRRLANGYSWRTRHHLPPSLLSVARTRAKPRARESLTDRGCPRFGRRHARALSFSRFSA